MASSKRDNKELADKLRKMASQCKRQEKEADIFKMAKKAETLTGLQRLKQTLQS